MLEQAAPPGSAPPKVDLPSSFLRRYEVAIRPASFTKPRKLREIKADGKREIE